MGTFLETKPKHKWVNFGTKEALIIPIEEGSTANDRDRLTKKVRYIQ